MYQLPWTWSRLSKSLITYIYIRQKTAKKSAKEAEKAKAEAQKRKFKEKKAEERALDEKLQKLNMEEREVHDAVGKAVSDMMRVERKYMMDSKQAIWWNLKQEMNW